MGHLRLLWRLVRLVLVELPICLLIAALIWSIIDNLTYGTDRLLVLGTAGVVAFAAILFFASRLFRRPSDAHGTATFATPADIGRAGLRSRGVILGKKGGRFVRFDRPGHLLT